MKWGFRRNPENLEEKWLRLAAELGGLKLRINQLLSEVGQLDFRDHNLGAAREKLYESVYNLGDSVELVVGMMLGRQEQYKQLSGSLKDYQRTFVEYEAVARRLGVIVRRK